MSLGPGILRPAMVLLLLLAGCSGASQEATIVVGVGPTVEQRVLAALTAEALQRADMHVELEELEGQTTTLRRRARADAIDLFWDYTGAAWALGLGERVPPAADPLESFEQIRSADQRNGLHWLTPTSANATLAMFVRAEDLPSQDSDRSLTWLAATLSSGDARLCADPQFLRSPAGLSALAVEYAINLDQVDQQPATEDEAIAAVAAGDCFAGLATATSGQAAVEGLVRVADVQSVFPAFLVAPVMRSDDEALRQRVDRALAWVTGALDTATLALLNAEVVAGGEPMAVAASFADAVLSSGSAPTPR